MEAEGGPWPLWGRVSRPKRQLACHGDLGLLEADASPQPVTPGLELAPLRHPGEQLFDPVAEDSAARLADDQTEVLRAEPRIWFSRSRLILTNCARAFRTARIS